MNNGFNPITSAAAKKYLTYEDGHVVKDHKDDTYDVLVGGRDFPYESVKTNRTKNILKKVQVGDSVRLCFANGNHSLPIILLPGIGTSYVTPGTPIGIASDWFAAGGSFTRNRYVPSAIPSSAPIAVYTGNVFDFITRCFAWKDSTLIAVGYKGNASGVLKINGGSLAPFVQTGLPLPALLPQVSQYLFIDHSVLSCQIIPAT
jgi:hypothetical protein